MTEAILDALTALIFVILAGKRMSSHATDTVARQACQGLSGNQAVATCPPPSIGSVRSEVRAADNS